MPWDPANKSANLALSNNNLTATATASATNAFDARSITSYASGKLYLEHKLTSITSGFLSSAPFGLCLSTFAITTDVYLGISGTDSLGFYSDGTIGNVVINNVSIGAPAPYNVNDTICMAVNRTANLIWFRVNAGNWNNSVSANPATGTGGFSLSALSAGAIFAACSLSQNTDSATSNFGRSAFAQAVPAGFCAWDPTLDMSSRGIICLQ